MFCCRVWFVSGLSAISPGSQRHIFASMSSRYILTMPKSKKSKKSQEIAGAVPVSQTQTDKEKSEEAISVAKDGHVLIKVQAKPGAKQNSITDISPGSVGIQIAAPPKDGEANEELVRYVASVLQVKKSFISLERGSQSRLKAIKIDNSGADLDQVKDMLRKQLLKD